MNTAEKQRYEVGEAEISEAAFRLWYTGGKHGFSPLPDGEREAREFWRGVSSDSEHHEKVRLVLGALQTIQPSAGRVAPSCATYGYVLHPEHGGACLNQFGVELDDVRVKRALVALSGALQGECVSCGCEGATRAANPAEVPALPTVEQIMALVEAYGDARAARIYLGGSDEYEGREDEVSNAWNAVNSIVMQCSGRVSSSEEKA